MNAHTKSWGKLTAFEDGEGVPNFPPLDCGCNLAPLKDRAIACPTLAMGVPTTEASDVNLVRRDSSFEFREISKLSCNAYGTLTDEDFYICSTL